MDNYGKVVATVGVKRDKKIIWLTEAEFLKVYGTMVKPNEQVTIMIDYYLVTMPAENVMDIIEDAVTARALDKFPADEECL
jgi:hypothetical protein